MFETPKLFYSFFRFKCQLTGCLPCLFVVDALKHFLFT